MYKTIEEPIQVLVSFTGAKIFPLLFHWAKRKYLVKKVHLVHIEKHGASRLYHFSVSDNANYFKLTFNSDTLQWCLSEMYTE
jgi:hypothetical protein